MSLRIFNKFINWLLFLHKKNRSSDLYLAFMKNIIIHFLFICKQWFVYIDMVGKTGVRSVLENLPKCPRHFTISTWRISWDYITILYSSNIPRSKVTHYRVYSGKWVARRNINISQEVFPTLECHFCQTALLDIWIDYDDIKKKGWR